MRSTMKTAFQILITLSLLHPAWSQNLVLDPSFEGQGTGANAISAPWSFTPASSLGDFAVEANQARTGVRSLVFGADGNAFDQISQTITTTVPNQFYSLTYYLSYTLSNVNDSPMTAFSAFWNGNLASGVFNFGNTAGYIQFQATVRATGNDVLTLGGRNHNGLTRLDDVALVSLAPPTPGAPEVSPSQAVVPLAAALTLLLAAGCRSRKSPVLS